MKLHANVFNYRISRFYTRVITRTAHVHALPTNITRRLHAFYARVGAAIPLTGTVDILPNFTLLRTLELTVLGPLLPQIYRRH